MQEQTVEPVVALVVAAGSGTRLGGTLPKALRTVAGRTLIARSVAAMKDGGCTHIVVVVADGLQDVFAVELADDAVQIVAGGAERQDSVRNGLVAIAANPDLVGVRVVLVHDAARALVPSAVVRRVIEAVRSGAQAVIPVIPVIDSIREVRENDSSVVDRSCLRAVQTPQGFDFAVLRQAHERVATLGLAVTDDAAACEALGAAVTLVEGAREAMKVTTPFDLVVAQALAERNAL